MEVTQWTLLESPATNCCPLKVKCTHNVRLKNNDLIAIWDECIYYQTSHCYYHFDLIISRLILSATKCPWSEES